MALSFALVPIAARWLGGEGFGIYSLGMVIMYFAFLLNDWGINTFITKEISRKKSVANKYFINALWLKLSLVIVVIIFLFGLLQLIDVSKEAKITIFLLGTFGILRSIGQISFSIFRAFEKMQFEMIIVILEKLIITCAGIFVLFQGLGLISFGSVFVVSALISLIVGFVLVRKKFIEFNYTIDSKLMKFLLLNSYHFGLSMFLINIYDKIDTVMLSFLKTMEAVGWYTAAYKLLSLTTIIPTVLVTAIFPKLSKAILSKEDNIVDALFTKSFKFIFFLALPLITIGSLTADKIITFIYGSQYSNSIVVFQVLSWAVGLIFLNILLGTLFRASDHQKKLVAMQGIGVLINISLNMVLIPKFSYLGAAIATVVTEAVLFTTYLRFITNKVCKLQSKRFIMQGLGATSLMVLVLLNFDHINLFFIIPLSGLTYFGSLYVFKGYKINEVLPIKGSF